jgi:hypothetical protein
MRGVVKKTLLWLVALTFLAAVVFSGISVRSNHTYHNERRRLTSLVESLRGRRPANVSEPIWNRGVDWTVTAHCEVFFSPEHASFANLTAYGKELEEKLRGPVDVNIFDWIWDQLEMAGPGGQRYVERFRPQLHEDMRLLAAARNER